MLKLSRQGGTLHIDPLEGSGATWHALLTITNGIVTECQIMSQEGTHVNDGPDSLQWLLSQNELTWKLTPPEVSPRAHEISPARFQQNHSRKTRDMDAALERKTARQETFLSSIETFSDRPQHTTLGDESGVHVIVSRKHRQVFNLVDGRKTPEEIAVILHRTPTEVRQILSDLHMRGLIQ
jgi:hypothetical protein